MRPVILLTNAIAPDKLGGLERYVRELATELSRRGRQVTIITKQVNDSDPVVELDTAGVRIVRHPVPSKNHPLFPLNYGLEVTRTVQREISRQPDSAIHGHYPISIAPLIINRRTAPFLYTFHNPVHKEVLEERNNSYYLPKLLEGAAVRTLALLEGAVVRRARKVFTLSEFNRNEVQLLSKRNPLSVSVVPGGIRTDFFTPGPRGIDGTAALGYPLLFTARRFTPRTGVIELVHAFRDFRRASANASLVIAGDGAMRNDIQALIEATGLSPSVRLVGRLGDAELRRWYRAADLTVMPTQEREGFGLTTAESLACGTPVFVTPAGANGELVAGLSPLLIADGVDCNSMSAGLRRYFDAPTAVREQAKLAARKAVHPRWSWATVADVYEHWYDNDGVK